ncbi:TPA: hypothetical protein DDW35_01760 [Candidatus Sumerlaeota bacterium]|nr:hypothetical protein [Candidatus Sumerlaeota bacterium]
MTPNPTVTPTPTPIVDPTPTPVPGSSPGDYDFPDNGTTSAIDLPAAVGGWIKDMMGATTDNVTGFVKDAIVEPFMNMGTGLGMAWEGYDEHGEMSMKARVFMAAGDIVNIALNATMLDGMLAHLAEGTLTRVMETTAADGTFLSRVETTFELRTEATGERYFFATTEKTVGTEVTEESVLTQLEEDAAAGTMEITTITETEAAEITETKTVNTATGEVVDQQSWSQTAKELGDAGEKAVADAENLTKNTTHITSPSDPTKDRIPDFLDTKAGTIGEVKNVKTLSLTAQIRDDIAYAQQNGYTFTLWTRSSTVMTGPLKKAIANGDIVHKFIPGF